MAFWGILYGASRCESELISGVKDGNLSIIVGMVIPD